MSIKSLTLAAFISSICYLVALSAGAQELAIKSNIYGPLLSSESTSTASYDIISVLGRSKPAPFYGIGGRFEGGYRGVEGVSDVLGTGSRYGGFFTGGNGSSSNYGVYATAYGNNAVAGYFSGNVHYTGTLTKVSDARVKQQIQDLDRSSVASLLRLKPKSYFYRAAEFRGMALPEDRQVGFLAQDVAAVFPELVKDVVAPNKDGRQAGEVLQSVDYVSLIPILVQAVQAQQQQIEELKAQLARRR